MVTFASVTGARAVTIAHLLWEDFSFQVDGSMKVAMKVLKGEPRSDHVIMLGAGKPTDFFQGYAKHQFGFQLSHSKLISIIQ